MKYKALLTATFLISVGSANAAINIIGDVTTQKGPDTVGASSNLGNGDFQSETATGAQPFSALSHWVNVSGAETTDFGVSNGTFGSPQSASLGAAFTAGVTAANDTGYVITLADVGNTLSLNMWVGQFGAQAGYDGDEIITASIYFLTATPGGGSVTDTTVLGDFTTMGSLAINPFLLLPTSPGFFNMVGGNIHTIAAGDVGKQVFLGLGFANATGATVAPRLDVVSLAVIPEPSAVLLGGLGLLGLLRRRRN